MSEKTVEVVRVLEITPRLRKAVHAAVKAAERTASGKRNEMPPIIVIVSITRDD
jgi:hypothetical protein